MRSTAYLVAACVLLSAALAAPAAAPAPATATAAADDTRPEIIEIIAPAASAQETLATLNLGSPSSEISDRNKRTIGILRQLFPQLTQMIEKKVQQITSVVLTTFGPTLLRVFLGNRGGAGKGEGGGTVELDDDEDDEPAESSTPPAPAPARRRRALRFPPGAVENQLLSGAESQQAEVRVAFDGASQAAESQPAAGDQQTAAQTNSATIDEITLDDADGSDENRNKRFLFGGSNGNTAGGGGGSGNFIFDIVRRPAEAVARAAGSAFRLLAGTDSLRLGLSATHSATLDPDNTQLVAGSASSGGDVTAAEGDEAGKGDNLTEGVPGPITRLFIIANRGVANLIQDLILRIAQTSERIVNFKARLITSII